VARAKRVLFHCAVISFALEAAPRGFHLARPCSGCLGFSTRYDAGVLIPGTAPALVSSHLAEIVASVDEAGRL
jgi:hypothetical protein